MYYYFNRFAVSLAVAMSLSLSAIAQDSSDQQQQRSEQEQSDNQRADDRQQDRESQDGQPRDFRIQPRGWVRVATDYNDDGRYDAVETIYYYDLQQARERSKQRSGREKDNASAKSSKKRNQQQFARKTSVQGEITKLKKETSSRENVRNVMARVKTRNGRTANVCLGPERVVSKLDLQQGDRVSADGVLARMNGKPVLLAARVKANGETVTHKLTRRKNINRHQGELVSLRTANSRRGDGQYCVARIDTDQGTKTVHLGPKKQLSKLDLSEGDQVSVLTREGKVSGKTALIALQVKANDETVKVIRTSMRQSRSDRNTDRS